MAELEHTRWLLDTMRLSSVVELFDAPARYSFISIFAKPFSSKINPPHKAIVKRIFIGIIRLSGHRNYRKSERIIFKSMVNYRFF